MPATSKPPEKPTRANATKRRLSGAALVTAQRARDRAEIPKVRGESGAEHRAFLVWAMAGGLAYPNQRALLDACARTASISAYNFRLSVKNKRFAQRVAGFAAPDEVAYVTYRRMYLLDFTGKEILAVAALLDPPPDSIPELWRCSAQRLLDDITARRSERTAHHERTFGAALADAKAIPYSQGPKKPPPLVDLDKVKVPADGKSVAGLLSENPGPTLLAATAHAGQTRGAKLDSKVRAAEAVARASAAVAKREKAGGERVVLTAQDARNVLRSIIGSPLDERTLREVDRELLAAARAAGPDAEVRLLSLLATQKAEAEAAAADPSDKLLKLIDASFGYFARELQAGKVKVTMSSLPMLIKARALLTGGATSRTEHTGLLNARSGTLRDSARVADARASKDQGALVRAMREDIAELAVILDALGDANVEDQPEVIDVPSAPVTQAAGE